METGIWPFLSFPVHDLKSIQDIPTNFATHIKQVSLMCLLVFSDLKKYD